MTNTKTIARNTGWYGLESSIGWIISIPTSIAIARYLGPTKMGFMISVMFIATVVGNLGGGGIPSTTRKYMAEFIGMGDRGTARNIYLRTLLLQTGLATLATAGLIYWVVRNAPTGYLLAWILVALSIWPAMVNFISAQANAATEELSTNLPASTISNLIYALAIVATVVLHWDVIGIGVAMLVMRLTDFLVRFFPTMKRILAWEKTYVPLDGLRARMMSFAWQSVASMTVAMIVWERSEFFLLMKFCPDVNQISFYSVAFSLADKLMIGSSIFGAAAGATIFAQYGRDKSKLPDIAASTFRYLVISSIPLHFIATALAAPALLFLYGNKYAGAAAVVTLAPILCMPKAFIGPVQSLLQSMERQSYVIGATILAGIADIAVAWWLILSHGAVGACIGSGVAQIMAVGIMWGIGIYLYKIKLPWMLIVKIAFISTIAALIAHFIAMRLAPLWGVLFGGVTSLIVLFALLYALRVLEPRDIDRFKILTGMLPKSMTRPANSLMSLLAGPQ